MSWWQQRGRTSIGAIVALVAVVAVVAFVSTRTGGAASMSLGPEGVPIPQAPSLARARFLTAGTQIDGIACQGSEQVLFHIHAHVTIFVRGTARQVPAGIGIAPPRQIAATPQGAFVTAGACFMWLHTHAADGIIHTESPVNRTYTLGDFFDVWGQPLNREQVGPAHGRVTALLNGRRYTGNPRAIHLLAHAQIQLEVGRPLVAPSEITFPNGL